MIFIFKNDFDELRTVPLECFGAVLQEAMIQNNLDSYRSLEELLKDNGMDVSEKRIAEYCKGIHTPPFEKAKEMLRVLDYDYSDEELVEAIVANREYAKNRPKSFRKKNDQELRISARLKLSKILPDVSPDRTSVILDNRIKDLLGGKVNYTEYLQALISKDLSEFILSEENFTLEEKK